MFLIIAQCLVSESIWLIRCTVSHYNCNVIPLQVGLNMFITLMDRKESTKRLSAHNVWQAKATHDTGKCATTQVLVHMVYSQTF